MAALASQLRRLHQSAINTRFELLAVLQDVGENQALSDLILEAVYLRNELIRELETAIDCCSPGSVRRSTHPSPLARIHAAWVDLKSAFSHHTEAVLIEQCLRLEDAELQEYDRLLSGETAPPSPYNEMLHRHCEQLAEEVANFEDSDPEVAYTEARQLCGRLPLAGR